MGGMKGSERKYDARNAAYHAPLCYLTVDNPLFRIRNYRLLSMYWEGGGSEVANHYKAGSRERSISNKIEGSTTDYAAPRIGVRPSWKRYYSRQGNDLAPQYSAHKSLETAGLTQYPRHCLLSKWGKEEGLFLIYPWAIISFYSDRVPADRDQPPTDASFLTQSN